jgi:hypothetical protein
LCKKPFLSKGAVIETDRDRFLDAVGRLATGGISWMETADDSRRNPCYDIWAIRGPSSGKDDHLVYVYTAQG